MPMTLKQLHRFWLQEAVNFMLQRGTDGDFLEFGVKYGSTAAIIAKFVKGQGFCFDTFSGFPNYSEMDAPTEGKKRRMERKLKGRTDVFKACKKNLIKQGVIDRCVLVRGDICETLPEFMTEEDNDNLCFAFMHIDTDLYDPANLALKVCWDKLLPDGVVYLHDYFDSHWPGIKIAVDDFVKQNKCGLFVFPREELCSAIILKNKDQLGEWRKHYKRLKKEIRDKELKEEANENR